MSTISPTRRRWILHPFLFAIYPVVALLAFNLGKLEVKDSIRSLLIAIAFATILILQAKAAIKDWEKAGLLASLFLGFFFSYSHLYRGMTAILPEWFSRNRNIYLPIIWFILLLWSGWFIVFRLKKTREISNILNIMVLVALAMPTFNIFSFVARNRELSEVFVRTKHVGLALNPPATDELPDIYYIVLDAYTREDTLLELYDYNNREFLDYLANKGFYVAHRSPTNYVKTMFVLSASLNARYVDDLAKKLGPDSINLIPLQELVRHNDVVAALSGIGYRIIDISTGFDEIELANADVHLRYDVYRPNEFESMLLRNTPVGVLVDRVYNVDSFYDLHRARIIYSVEQLEKMPEEPGPKFVFAHVLAPHPPFVFGPNGEEVNLDVEPEQHYHLPAETYISAYRDQVNYTNQLVMRFIDQILNNSERPPIIILQGDHGPRLYLGKTPEQTCLMERFTILNSFYFPDGNYDRLYDSITPVNTFRVVFDQFLGTDLGLLEDKTYHSVWARLYDFKDVSDRVNTCTIPDS